MGLDRCIAEAPLLVHLVIGEVSLEPFDMAVALEGEDECGEMIEEEAIVADGHGATGEVFQCRFERSQRLNFGIGAARRR